MFDQSGDIQVDQSGGQMKAIHNQWHQRETPHSCIFDVEDIWGHLGGISGDIRKASIDTQVDTGGIQEGTQEDQKGHQGARSKRLLDVSDTNNKR